MIEVFNENSLTWVNVVAPTPEELAELAEKYQLHPTSIKDCLDPEHLPKIELVDSTYFVICRYYDKRATAEAETTQELTRKIAFFIKENTLITIQREAADFWNGLYQELKKKKMKSGLEGLLRILPKIQDSYDIFFTNMENQLEGIEGRLFHQNTGFNTLKTLNHLKRQNSIIKHILNNTQTVIIRIPSQKDLNPYIQDQKEEVDALLFRANSLVEEVSNLLQLYLSLAGHRTNEIVRVLTIFSVFFMPLTFIVGVYGMNFKNMPELTHQYGYPGVWVLLIGTALGIWLWFKSKKWL